MPDNRQVCRDCYFVYGEDWSAHCYCDDNMVEDKMKKFWVVWNESGRYPFVKHESYDLARLEAERLAGKQEGVFIVLEAVSVTARVSVETKRLE